MNCVGSFGKLPVEDEACGDGFKQAKVIVFHSKLTTLRKGLRSNAAVWVSWPKRASKVPTDITEDTIRELALPLGFVRRK